MESVIYYGAVSVSSSEGERILSISVEKDKEKDIYYIMIEVEDNKATVKNIVNATDNKELAIALAKRELRARALSIFRKLLSKLNDNTFHVTLSEVKEDVE